MAAEAKTAGPADGNGNGKGGATSALLVALVVAAVGYGTYKLVRHSGYKSPWL